MHITILALGSRGDVQPYAALGKGLQNAGYSVRLVTFENFRSLAEGQGLDFLPIKGDAQALLNSGAGMQFTESSQNPIKMMRGIQATFGQLIEDYIEGFGALANYPTDAIINQLPAALFGNDLAEALGVPHLVASVIPLEPTRAFPLSLMATRPMGPLLNRFSYDAAWQMAWQPFRKGINRFRKQLGLPPAGLAGRKPRQPDPVLNGFSRHVVPPPPDWGSHVHVTGYWTLDESRWQPPQSLVDFLNQGKPPIFVGFGSMPMRDPQATLQTVVKALQISGQRGVISSGWAQMNSRDLPETIYQVDYAPYEWLFPRMAAVVHHGGSGTTGLGVRAGVPTVIVPFVADQPYWGARMVALGVGPKPVPYKSLTAEALAGAISQTIADAGMRQRAAQLGEQLRREDGMGTAVQVINRLLNAVPAPVA